MHEESATAPLARLKSPQPGRGLVPVGDRERFQVALMDGAYESLRRLARAVDDLDNHERRVP